MHENNWSMSSWVCPTGKNPIFTYDNKNVIHETECLSNYNIYTLDPPF